MSAKKLTLSTIAMVLVVFAVLHRLGLSPIDLGSSEKHSAAEFALTDLQGKEHRLAEFKGGPVLLHFWASWCAPCLDELPGLLKRFSERERKDLKLITISWDSTWGEAQAILDKLTIADQGGTWLSLIDQNRKLGPLYGTYQLPETYLLNANQEIEMKWVGSQKWDQARFDSVFKKK